MLADVLLDLARDQVAHRTLRGEPLAHISRADRQRRDVELQHAIAQPVGLEVAEVVTGASGRHEGRQLEALLGVLPRQDVQDRVGAGDEEQVVASR